MATVRPVPVAVPASQLPAIKEDPNPRLPPTTAHAAGLPPGPQIIMPSWALIPGSAVAGGGGGGLSEPSIHLIVAMTELITVRHQK